MFLVIKSLKEVISNRPVIFRIAGLLVFMLEDKAYFILSLNFLSNFWLVKILQAFVYLKTTG